MGFCKDIIPSPGNDPASHLRNISPILQRYYIEGLILKGVGLSRGGDDETAPSQLMLHTPILFSNTLLPCSEVGRRL